MQEKGNKLQAGMTLMTAGSSLGAPGVITMFCPN